MYEIAFINTLFESILQIPKAGKAIEIMIPRNIVNEELRIIVERNRVKPIKYETNIIL